MLTIPMLASFSLAKVFGFFATKKRLIIEYLLIGVIIVLCASMFTLWLQKRAADKELDKVQEKVTLLEVTASAQEHSINNLRNLRARDAQILNGLLTDFKNIRLGDKTIRDKLKELESNDESVQAYYSTPVPPVIACLLERTCEGLMPSP